MSYLWTIPIGQDDQGYTKLAYLELPERNLTEAEWQRLMKVLELFKPGLVISLPGTLSEPTKPEAPQADTPAS